MKTVILLTAIVLYTASEGYTQSRKEYQQRIAILQQNISQYFYDSSTGCYKEFDVPAAGDKPYSYLWPLCALIQAANETEAVALQRIPLTAVLDAIQVYADNRPPAPAYASYIASLEKSDRFYDDNQWIGIACMDAYARTGNHRYLAEGEKIYRYMMTGYDTVSGGGLYWKEGDFSTKNTCSNGPAIILALQLYKVSGRKAYLDTALLLYGWTNAHLLSPQGLYYDNVNLPARSIDTRTYTYNTGTLLQANVLLYDITGRRQYLTEARRLAAAAYTHFFRNGRFPGNAWFNAVLLRGYLALNKYDSHPEYILAFKTDAEAIWSAECDQRHLLGSKEKKELIEQAAMLEIYARLLPFVE